MDPRREGHWMSPQPRQHEQQGKRRGKAGNMQGYLHSRRDPRSQNHMQGQYHSHQGHGALRIGRHGPAHPSGNQQQDGALQQHAGSSGLIAGLNGIDPTPPPEHDKKGCRQSDIPCTRHQNDLRDRVRMAAGMGRYEPHEHGRYRQRIDDHVQCPGQAVLPGFPGRRGRRLVSEWTHRVGHA